MSVNTYNHFLSSPLKNISTSQNGTCFSVVLKNKVVFFSIKPFRLLHTIKDEGGFKFVEMYWNSNLVGIVGREKERKFKFNSDTLSLYDLSNGSIVAEIKFKKGIRNFKFSLGRIAVCLRDKTHLFHFEIGEKKEIKLRQIFDACNSEGILACSQKESKEHNVKWVVAFPGEKEDVSVVIEKKNGKFKLFHFRSHNSRLSCLSLNDDGSLLATASTTGTLIRVYKTLISENQRIFHKKSQLLQILRRGTDNSIIYSISFRNDSKFLCVTSDKQSIHFFSTIQDKKEKSRNKLNFRGLGSTEVSFAKYKLKFEGLTKFPPSVSYFYANNLVVVLNTHGKLIFLDFDENSGIVELKGYRNFVSLRSKN